METYSQLPNNEQARLKALESYNILDTVSELEFDRLTELASLICGTPISLISLVDKDRQWFKSKKGLDVSETNRDISFCQHAILGDEIFQVTDATKDERFKENPLVKGNQSLRFYAGYPLIDKDGFALGTLCVIGKEPKELSKEQYKALTLLGKEVVSQIIARKERMQLYDFSVLFKTSVDLVCIAETNGFFTKINPAFTDILGWTKEELLNNSFFEYIHPEDRASTQSVIVQLAKGVKTVNFIIRFQKKNQEYITLQWTANTDKITGKIYAIGRDVTQEKKIETELYDYAELFKTATDMVCLSSSDGYFKQVNPAFTHVLGWSEEELLKEPYVKFIHPDDLLKTKNEVLKLRDGLKSYSFINRLLTKSGDYRTVQWASNPSKISGFTYAIARDITDIIEKEKELENTLYEISQLQLALDEAAIVSKTDQDFKVIYVNDKFCEISGYTKEELLGIDQVKHSSNYHTKEFMMGILETVTSGKIWKGQVKSRKKNGEPYWVDTTAVPLVKNGNKPHGYITIRYDITLQKKIEEEVTTLAELQGAILDGTNYSIIATNPEGIIISFNKGAEDMLGYKEDEVIHKLNLSAFHDAEEVVQKTQVLSNELNTDLKPGFETLVAKSRQGKPDVNEWTYLRKDGLRLSVILSVSTLYNSKKAITGYLGIARDITETKKSQELLKRSEEKHRLFFENAQGLMCTHDRSGKFLSINRAGAALIGYTPEELINKTLFEVTPDNVKKDVEKYIHRIYSTASDEGLLKVLHKNGEVKVWFYKNILVRDTNDKDIVIGNAIDISERIKSEKQLHQAKLIAEKSVLAKDQFLANMSHEIRTPMNAILGFSDVLKSTTLDEKQKEYLNAISNSGENLLVIINDILDFSKIESGKLSLENKSVNIREIVNHVKNLLAFKAKERNIALNFYIENEVPAFVLADKVRLDQILVNLIGNALKFTEQGKVELYCNVRSSNNSKCEIEFIVKDTGIGISEDNLEVIFERFKQAEDNTTRKFGGTGLGLSITKRLVEIFGGSIQVQSKLGIGSEFKVIIPFTIADGPTEKKTPVTNPNKPQKSVNVLLVEDNKLNQKLAKHILEANNFTVEIADDGQKAVEILKSKSFGIILMDLQMPVMDGYVATSFIRNVLKLKTPIVAMTAHSLIGEKEKCLENGMNSYLSKPYKAQDLIDVIDLLVDDKIIETKEDTNMKLSKKEMYDLEGINELSNNDVDFVQDMIKVLIAEMQTELKKIQKFSSENDLKGLQRVAHKIKSSFALFRMEELVTIAKNIEAVDNIEESKVVISQLVPKVESVLVEISKEIKV